MPGTPAISDPGELLISAAIEAGHTVSAVPGPSAALSALVVAGLGTARWRFEGFLPRRGPTAGRPPGRDRGGTSPERHLRGPPARRRARSNDLAAACGGGRKVAVCRELTKRFEETWRGTLAEACARSKTESARGEHVLVVAGTTAAKAPASEEEVRRAVESRMSGGASRRQAATEVAAELGVSKRVAYETSLAHGDR